MIEFLDRDWLLSAACAKKPMAIENFDPNTGRLQSKEPLVTPILVTGSIRTLSAVRLLTWEASLHTFGFGYD